MFKIIEYR